MHDPVIALAPNLRRLHPLRSMGWAILFVKEFCIYSVWVPLHRERPVAQMRQKHRRDLNVVIDYLPLGEADLRIENLVQVRDRELFSVNYELGFFRHLTNVQRPGINRNLKGRAPW